jgi:hypothetical protein
MLSVLAVIGEGAIIGIVTFLLILHRVTVASYLLRIYIHYFVRVSRRAKCPGCGSRRKHEIVFSGAHIVGDHSTPGAILHRCVECKAVYSDLTLVDPAEWVVQAPADPDASTSSDPRSAGLIPRSPGEASREPLPFPAARTTNVMRDQSVPTVTRN